MTLKHGTQHKKKKKTWTRQSLYKWCPWVDTDLFYKKINFVYLGFNI